MGKNILIYQYRSSTWDQGRPARQGLLRLVPHEHVRMEGPGIKDFRQKHTLEHKQKIFCVCSKVFFCLKEINYNKLHYFIDRAKSKACGRVWTLSCLARPLMIMSLAEAKAWTGPSATGSEV